MQRLAMITVNHRENTVTQNKQNQKPNNQGTEEGLSGRTSKQRSNTSARKVYREENIAEVGLMRFL